MTNNTNNATERQPMHRSLWRALGFAAAILMALAVGPWFFPSTAQGQIPPQSPCPPTPPSWYHYCGREGGKCDQQEQCSRPLYAWHTRTACCHLDEWNRCYEYVGEWWCCPPKDGVPAGWRSACIGGDLAGNRCVGGTRCE